MRFHVSLVIEADTDKRSSAAEALEELDEALSQGGAVSDEIIAVEDIDGTYVNRMGFAPGKGV